MILKRRKKHALFIKKMKYRFTKVIGIKLPKRIVRRKNKITLSNRFYSKFYDYMFKTHKRSYRISKIIAHGSFNNVKRLHNVTNKFWWYDIKLKAKQNSLKNNSYRNFKSIYNTK